MRRPSYFGYLCLMMTAMAIVSLPAGMTKAIKNRAIAFAFPFASLLHPWQTAGASTVRTHTTGEGSERCEKLEMENLLLREQCDALQQMILSDDYIAKQTNWLLQIQGREKADPQWTEFFKRRARHLSHRLQLQLQSLPAKVVFRDMRHWGSTFWIDVGEVDNEKIGSKIIAHNSPVVMGSALVGIVEHVGRKRSEVRLLTDAHLVPSIRAVRGEQSHRALMLLIDQLAVILQKRSGLYSSGQEEKNAIAALSELRRTLQQGWGDYYLAKGEVYGSSLPLWRSKRPLLNGIGFNYDTADEEGQARDLRTGGGVPLLQPGDLLVTSGLDGLFPQGLEVGIVGKVKLLREGDCSYDLEAIPVITDFSAIERVTVLPPLKGNEDG